jgi:hypothetical protein
MKNRPKITNHAFQRAQERLGMDSLAFRNWVNITHPYWTGVNGTFLKSRNINLVGKPNTSYYTNPLTSEWSVLMVVEAENLVTVLDYYELNKTIPPENIADVELKPVTPRVSPLGRILDQMCRDGLVSTQELSQLLRINRGLLSQDIKYVTAYGNGRITYPELKVVLESPAELREALFREAVGE